MVPLAKSIALFIAAAFLEIGGAWLVWQGVREHLGWVWIGFGLIALGTYGFVATLQPDAHFGRILAAYGGGVRGRLAAVGDGGRRLPAGPLGCGRLGGVSARCRADA